MAKLKKTEKVPQSMEQKFRDIVTLTDQFSQEHLNDEYAQEIRYAVAALCRKRPSPLASGQAKTWACGITHAIGMVNFLFDSSQTPHLQAGELYKLFGVSASTGQGKSKVVRDALKMSQLSADWMLPSKIDQSIVPWMISYDGFMLDARSLPLPIQQVAYEKGLIPYVPGTESDPAVKVADNSKNQTRTSKRTGSSTAIYTLEVFIIGGPITDAFIAKNPEIVRIIEIQGKQTLADLHAILFKAFDREEEHLYEFQLGGQGPGDPNAERYGLVSGIDFDDVKDAKKTAIASLGLAVDDAFGYWFDFGDDWWHQVNVIAIEERKTKGNYPRVVKRIGASPPQYADFDEEG